MGDLGHLRSLGFHHFSGSLDSCLANCIHIYTFLPGTWITRFTSRFVKLEVNYLKYLLKCLFLHSRNTVYLMNYSQDFIVLHLFNKQIIVFSEFVKSWKIRPQQKANRVHNCIIIGIYCIWLVHVTSWLYVSLPICEGNPPIASGSAHKRLVM